MRPFLVLFFVVVSLGTAGCGGDLQFRNDERLTFMSPSSRELVSVPLVVTWKMRDFDVVGLDGSSQKDRGAFAVFVDRAPMPAGKDLRWLMRDDPACKRVPTCPDQAYLNDRNIYVTSARSVEIASLPPVAGVGDEEHFINVVLLDGKGRRIGESAWYLQFRSKRRGS